MSEELDYLFTSFDCHLRSGMSPRDAWQAAIEDYAVVYHSEDDETPFVRAANVALKRLKEDEK